jgi:hypothetical protein
MKVLVFKDLEPKVVLRSTKGELGIRCTSFNKFVTKQQSDALKDPDLVN